MQASENHVRPDSNLYFHTRSELAGEIFFYPICTGYFHCDPGYRVERRSYDSFLLLYVCRGQGYARLEEQTYALQSGDFLLADCYSPHCYGTDTGWDILWLHFDGILAARYCEQCTKSGPVTVPGNPQECQRQLRRIYEIFQRREKVSEADLSRRIICILTDFMQAAPAQSRRPRQQGSIEEVLGYISDNLSRKLTLEELAKHAALSPYYFSRLFKQETGYAPHEYLILSRVNKAKYLLKSTRLPLKEIADVCGFGNTSNFSATFKKVNGCTPLSYRNEQQ